MKRPERKAKVIVPGPGMWILGLILLVLKLSGTIDWDWWIVLLPFYFAYAVVFGFIAFFMTAALVCWVASMVLLGIITVCAAAVDLWTYLRRR